MFLRAPSTAFELPFRAVHWHALAEAIEDLPRMFTRWNRRRRTAAELRTLSRAQLIDIGLEGVDPEEFAERFVR